MAGELRYGNPWADPEGSRDPARRLRGRLATGVTIWTAGTPSASPAGITVSSLVLAQGAPPRLAGLVGPDTDFAEALQDASRSPAGFVVHVLADDPVHRRLAQHFAGVLPVPDGQVTWVDTPRGPALAAVADRLWCASPDARPFGWSLLVEAEVVHAEVGPALPALLWHRGRFIRSAPA